MPKLLILGGGYGGLAVAQTLDAVSRGRSNWEVTMLDRRDFHLIQVRVHEVAANTIPADRVRIPFKELLAGRNVKFVQTEIQAINPQNNTVQTTGGELGYDRLVIGLGSTTAWRNIAGMPEHSYPMKDLEDAMRYRKAVIAAFKQVAADRENAKVPDERLTFVIGGGGLTGTELAGEMIDFCRDLTNHYKLPERAYRIILLEAAEHILPQLNAGYSEYARNELRARGVTIATKAFIEKVEEGAVYLKDGRVVKGRVICWAGGIEAPRIIAESGFEVTRDGRIPTDEFLRSRQFPNVYALGDSAAIPDTRSGGTVPLTGQYAERQGHYLGEALWDEERGLRPHMYQPFSLGTAVSLGRNEALTITGPIKLTGIPGRLAKNVSYDNYEWNIRYKPRILSV
jgi:NADH:ubiquinone reductase (H+-translocating)